MARRFQRLEQGVQPVVVRDAFAANTERKSVGGALHRAQRLFEHNDVHTASQGQAANPGDETTCRDNFALCGFNTRQNFTMQNNVFAIALIHGLRIQLKGFFIQNLRQALVPVVVVVIWRLLGGQFRVDEGTHIRFCGHQNLVHLTQ